MQRRVLVAGLVAAFGCSGSPAAGPTPRAGGADPAAGVPAFLTPARWDFHPGAPEQVVARVRLPDGGCVLAAEGGQRWSVVPNGARAGSGAGSGTCVGRASASSALAPEEIVDIVRRSQSSWFFVGATGRIYESNDPLGPFARSIDAPEPFAKVAGASGRLLGVTLAGRLLRWEDDGGWREAAANPGGVARIFDLAIGDDGRALALAYPEALFTSEDGGTNWKRAAAAPVGAQRVGLTDAGELAAEGIFESIVWSPQRSGPLARSPARVARARVEPDLDAGRAPSAAAVLAGRAVIDGDRYFEAVRPEQEAEDWLLAQGRIEGRLETQPIPGSGRCDGGKLAASGRHVVLLCLPAPQSGVASVVVLRSTDTGHRWAEQPGARFETPSVETLSAGLAPDGGVLLGGVCRPGREGSCKPSAPILLKNDGSGSSVQVAAPDLREVAVGAAFSIDGRSAYLLGRRSKDGLLALFVSHDGGESFAARPLDPPGSGRSARAALPDDEDSPPPSAHDGEEPESTDEFEVAEGSAIHPGEDGTVGIALMRPRGSVYVTTNEDGRLLDVAYPENDGAVVSGFGRRVLAVSAEKAEGADESDVDVRESLDGGANWNRVSHTPALAHEFLRGSSAVACGAGGCVFGDTVSRVGWVGQAESGLASRGGRTDVAPPRPPGARTPIVCEVAASSRYKSIEQVHGGNAGASMSGVPTLDQIGRARWLWSVLAFDRASGEAKMVGAMLPESDPPGEARVVTRVLFGKAPKGPTFAMRVAPQMEGYAVVRVEVPSDAKGEPRAGAPMRNVEIAWENLLEGSSGRATLADAGPFESGDVHADAVRPDYAPDLLSVSPHGIYLRPHHSGARSMQTWFFDVTGRSESFAYPTWPDKSLGGELKVQSEAAYVDGNHLAVGIVQPDRQGGSPTTMLLAKRDNKSWTIQASSLAPPAAASRMLGTLVDWTYSGKTLGVTTLVSDLARGRAWAQFHAFRADGTFAPPVAMPTQIELGDRPRPCSAADRASTPRLEAPLVSVESGAVFLGTQHPVLIVQSAASKAQRSDARDAVLSTGGVVLYGTTSSPCVAAWEASDRERRVGAVISGDLSRAFLFRPAAGPSTTGQLSARAPRPQAIEYRPMVCRFDPSATVPEGT